MNRDNILFFIFAEHKVLLSKRQFYLYRFFKHLFNQETFFSIIYKRDLSKIKLKHNINIYSS